MALEVSELSGLSGTGSEPYRFPRAGYGYLLKRAGDAVFRVRDRARRGAHPAAQLCQPVPVHRPLPNTGSRYPARAVLSGLAGLRFGERNIGVMDTVGPERWSEAFPWLTRNRLVPRLRDLLQASELAQRSSAAALRAMGRLEMAEQADGYAARVREDLDNPLAPLWLHAMERELMAAPTLDAVLDRALTGALWLMGATRGNVQLVVPRTGVLRIAAHRGFSQDFLDYFGTVSDTASACGRAAGEQVQVVIADVGSDPGFAPHRGVAAAAGFRAVQSTPLIDASGQLRGVLSTHYPDAYRPPDESLALMRRYGALIGNTLTSAA